MAKTAAAAEEPKKPKKKHICEKCGSKLKYDRKTKTYFCPQCLFGAYLTDEAQRKAVKRYRQSDKGKEAERKYEQSEKGKTARQKYLKSEKYKQRRREYNQRLKESLAIARAAQLSGARKLTKAEQRDKYAALMQDIKDFIDMMHRSPTAEEVKTWAEDYQLDLLTEDALELIKRAKHETV